MADPALDDVERHTFAGELDGVGVVQLMRREATSHTRVGVRADGTRPGATVAGGRRTGRNRSDEAAVTWRTERISSVGG